jgi:hypothetical protein
MRERTVRSIGIASRVAATALTLWGFWLSWDFIRASFDPSVSPVPFPAPPIWQMLGTLFVLLLSFFPALGMWEIANRFPLKGPARLNRRS